jgi:hypothetical protein
MPEGVPDEYLDMVMTCPNPKGQGEGAKPLREVLASDIGPKIMPTVVENIQNAQELTDMGVDYEKAVLMAFGGAIVRNEAGGILREPEPEPEPGAEAVADQPEPHLQAAEKK